MLKIRSLSAAGARKGGNIEANHKFSRIQSSELLQTSFVSLSVIALGGINSVVLSSPPFLSLSESSSALNLLDGKSNLVSPAEAKPLIADQLCSSRFMLISPPQQAHEERQIPSSLQLSSKTSIHRSTSRS